MSNNVRRPFSKFVFLARMTGAVRVHVPTYVEVQLDQSATFQALFVVILAAAATGSGLGVGLGYLPMWVVIWGAGWLACVLIIYLLGTTIFQIPGFIPEWGQLVRTTGFAQAPAVFQILGIFPIVGASTHLALVVLVEVWTFIAMTVAVRLSFKFSSVRRAVMIVALSLIPWKLIEVLSS